MKKIYFFLLLAFLGMSPIYAQVSNYIFSQVTSTYNPISGGILLGSTTSDDQYFVNPAIPLGGFTVTGPGFPIGFNFTFNGTVFDRIGVQNNGWIGLGQSALNPSVNLTYTSYVPISSAGAINPAQLRSRIAGMGKDLQAQPGASIRIETLGTAPNQICVIQFSGYRKFNQAGDNINFQIRLYETTNVVEILYGPVILNATTGTAQVGLGGNTAADFNNRTTAADWNASTAGTAATATMPMGGSAIPPASGTTFRWTPPPVCTGAPTPGNTISTSNTICSGINFTLSLQNNPAVSGLTYQWQSSTDGTTYTNIAGATNPTFTTSQTTATYYQAIVTCSGTSTTSTPVQITMNAPTSCYCIPGVTSCTASDVITNVTVSTLNNNSACSANGYADYSTTVANTNLIQGASNPMSVTVGPGGTEHVGIWIDYNQNGIFDATEFTDLGSGNGVTINGTLTIPSTAPLGTTRMRVRVRYNTALTGTDACIGYTFGETEDYKVTITPCITGVINSQPVNATIACGGNTTFSVGASGSGLSYFWEYRTSPTASWLNVPSAAPYSGENTSTLTITNGTAAISGYQYRAIISGACTGAFGSSEGTLTVTPYLAPVSPVPTVKCSGSSLQIFASPPPTVTTVCSPTLNTVIPDGNATGINHTLNVSGIPAGATITNVSVKVNINHAYVSDLMLVIKAPNGKILNLSNLIGAGNNPGVNFTNTIFSSATGLPALSSGTSPGYTGIFAPDAAPAVGAFGIPSGPTGYVSNTTSFASLFSQPNGAWTIAMYDAGPPDQGTLVDWCINITWGVTPATGVFSPTTDLWLDAAGTIPYTGTAVNSVYTTTASNTTYTAVVSNGTCTSAPTAINVTVTDPLTTVTVPTTTSVCDGNTTTISATAATGTAGVINYQWEVSADGTTYSAISNGGIYSGATTGTLTITGASSAINGYKYRVKAGIAACGSNVTSNAGDLIVNPNPIVNLAVSPHTSLTPGMTTTLTATSIPGATYTWFRNGVIVPNTSGNTLLVDIDGLGEYTVSVSDANTCGGVSNAITISDSSSNIMFIYPSPNTGQFQVRYFSVAGNTSLPRMLNVYDAKGARVYSRMYPINAPYEKLEVDLRNHGKGVYMVELADRNGNRLKAGRVVIF